MTEHFGFALCIILGCAGVALIVVDARWSQIIGGVCVGVSIGIAHAVGRYL